MSGDVYVCFTRAKTKVSLFLHKEISHCFCMWPDSGVWVVYDKAVNKDDIFIVPNYSDILSESLILKVKCKDQSPSLFAINTCVGTVKRMIGMKDWRIQTPYQLFKELQNGRF